jgi:NAD(P)-dependent dehydrogenase (short-subunit alcohol dehydrogenase family)
MKSVLITGVSSGIGLDTTRELIEHDYHVFGSVRTKSDARKLSDKFGEKFTPLIFDVCEVTAIVSAAMQVKEKLGNQLLSGLINNAGIVVAGPLMHIPHDELQKQFDVNVYGVMNVIREFLPLLGAINNNNQTPGRIINISSVSGSITYPFIGPYAASKHALESLSEALRRELMLYGIDVILIIPGNTDTLVWDKAKSTPEYKGTDYESIILNLREGLLGGKIDDALPVEKVSRLIHYALRVRKPKNRYIILKHKFMGWYLPKFLPDRWLDKMIANRLGINRQKD